MIANAGMAMNAQILPSKQEEFIGMTKIRTMTTK